MNILLYGFGHIARALTSLRPQWSYRVTARDAAKRQSLEGIGHQAVDPSYPHGLIKALAECQGLLVSAPPQPEGCPAYLAMAQALMRRPDVHVIYLSTTGLYGDAQGRWVDETTPEAPSQPEGRLRWLAETQWSGLHKSVALTRFRLPGLYGEGRNVFERLIKGEARLINKPLHVFSRLHHDDAATAIALAFEQTQGGLFNLTDDLPASANSVLLYGTKLLNRPEPKTVSLDDPEVSAMSRRFYADNKRVNNAKAKATLGWRPLYPTYKEGLQALVSTYL